MSQSVFKGEHNRSWSLQILIPALILSVIGILTLLSTTVDVDGGFSNLEIVYKQVIFVILGISSYYVITKVNLTYLKHWQVLFLINLITITLLLLTLLFAPTINYVKRWLVIGGVQIQPSEIAKVSVILTTALIISQKKKFNEIILFLISLVITIPSFILIYLEPDASMSVLILALWFFVAFLGLNNPLRNTILLSIFTFLAGGFVFSVITGSNLWYLLIAPGLIIAIFAFYSQNNWKNLILIVTAVALLSGFLFTTVWGSILQDYQKNRIEAFVNPSETEGDIGFNVNQSRIAIGSGKIWGKGFGNGTQSKRDFLPEHQTDFIFASFAEEFGLVGSLFLIFLYGYLIIYAFMIAMRNVENPMFSLIALGLGLKILLEVFINIGTNTGAIPATGIPLPLMSAGGTITILTFVGLGILDNISRSREYKPDIIDTY